jgi:dihydropteroate synthase
VTAPADLVFPAPDRETLAEILSWDGVRAASFGAAEFPLDVVRLAGAPPRPLPVGRARRAETVKALPASLRERVAGALERAERAPAVWRLARGRALDLSETPLVMGVVNVTPDSFSDGGLAFDRDRAVARSLELFDAGAAIVDVGGESTRPANYGEADEVDVAEELGRVLPVLEGIRRRTDAPVSVDTRKAAVARAALERGADAINDVSALRHDPEMAPVAAEWEAGVVLMHMRGDDPRRMQDDVSYSHPVADVAQALADGAERARAAGVPADRIAVDPGLGFGKSPDGNLVLLRHLAAFRTLGFAVAIGASRKGFVRRFSGVGEGSPSAERLPGSLAAVGAARAAGAALVRVHDVAETVRFLRMARAISRPAPVRAGAAAAS